MSLCQYNDKAKNKCRIKFITARYSSELIIRLQITKNGWVITSTGLVGGDSNPDGNPFFYKFLDHDDVDYPTSLSETMTSLWRKAHIENFDDQRLQRSLKRIEGWVNEMNLKSPTFKLTKVALNKQNVFCSK